MLTIPFAILEFVNVFLNTYLGLLALHIADRDLSIGMRNLVFVDASGCFFEEVLSCTVKHRRLPVDPSVLRRNNKGFGIRGVERASELENSVKAKGEEVVDPFVWSG